MDGLNAQGLAPSSSARRASFSATVLAITLPRTSGRMAETMAISAGGYHTDSTFKLPSRLGSARKAPKAGLQPSAIQVLRLLT